MLGITRLGRERKVRRLEITRDLGNLRCRLGAGKKILVELTAAD